MRSASVRRGGASVIATDPPAGVILDARTRVEYDSGHVPGARHLPLWKALTSSSANLPAPNEPVTVYCLLGPRAWMVGQVLRLRGHRDVRLLPGHMRRWRKDGKPLE